MRTRLVGVGAAILASLGIAVSAVPAEAARGVGFGKIQYDSPGADSGSNKSLNAEWVTIKNTAGRARVLTGWTLRDATGHVYKFPTFTLRPGKAVRVHTGRGSNTATNLYWDFGDYVWNNSGDKAILKNKAGVRLDTCRWGDGSGSIVC